MGNPSIRIILYVVAVSTICGTMALAISDSRKNAAQRDAERRAYKEAREAVFAKCESEVAPQAAERLANLPKSPQKACREWMYDLVHGSLKHRCLFAAGAIDESAFMSDCWPLRQLQKYCDPRDWPPDAFDPGIRSACNLG
jgi:hypothetical protein